MSENLDPIEIQFLINSPEVLEDAMRVEQSLQGVDKAVAKTEASFQAYVQQQLEANKAMQDGVKLGQAQQQTFDRYVNTLSHLQGLLNQTTDPTQLAVYNKEIEVTTEKLNKLIENNRITIDTTELEKAGHLLDSIADKTFTPDFASNAELENLSVHINRATDEFGQLGAVIDFVEAKMSGMDKGSDTYKNLSKDIELANEMLGRTVVAYDATNNSIDQLNDALKAQKDLLFGETDISKITILNQNIEELETKLKQLQNVGKSGFDEFGNKITEQTEATKGLKGQLADLVQQMAQLKMAGKDNTEAYRELSAQATSLRSAISTVNQEITQTASATNNLDTLIRATKGIASGYAVAKSASALFGSDQKNVEQAILKVTSAMSLLQGLQVIQAELLRKESMSTKGLIVLKKLYAKAVGESTGAMKTFKVALLASGVGVFIVLLGELIANWDKVKRSIGLTSDELERTQAISKKANDLFGDQIAKLRMLAATNKEVVLTDEQKKEAVKDFNKEFGNTLGTVKDYADLEERIIKNAPAYIEYLQVKAQAEASYILSLEKQKNLLEQITALSTGDLKWYEQLQDFTDKMYEKGWKAIGADIGEVNRDISQSEILSIIGLPDENNVDEALRGYSPTIQNKVKDFWKQQQKDEALYSTSFDLQKQAGELASKLDLTIKDKEEDKAAKKAFQERIKALQEIAKAEDAYQRQRLTGVEKELLAVEQRYKALKEQSIKAKLDAKDIARIDKLEVEEKAHVTYADNTEKLIKQLDREKELYKLYEEAKTIVGASEIAKRQATELKGAKSFQERLASEIAIIEETSEANRVPAQQERLKKLLEMQKEHLKELQQLEDEREINAYQSSLTTQERIELVSNDFAEKRKQLEKVTNKELRTQKLEVLKQQEQDVIDSIRNEAYHTSNARKDLFDRAIGLSKQEYESRLNSLKEYLDASSGLLDADTEKALRTEIERAEGLFKLNELSRDEKILLERKDELIRSISEGQKKGADQVARESEELKQINAELSDIATGKMQAFADRAYEVSDAMNIWANAIGDGNEDLSKTLKTVGEIANDVGNVVDAFSKGVIDGIVSLVVTVGKWIGSIFTNAKKNRAEDRKLMEEIKKSQAEAFQSQLDYNKEVRNRMMMEARINDLYESRASSLKEELEVLKRQKESVAEDMQTVFDRLLGSETIVNERLENKKFLGIKRKKKKKITDYETISEILGLEEGAEITDAIFEQLEKLNAKRPLTGDAKEAYEQLKKLKEEYGSIDEARMQAEIELKNIVTGTTADAIANSIREGIASGKKSFADFADDIEGFLRDAILAGMSARVIEPQIQELQDALYEMMGDGVLSGDEMKEFQEMYMKIVNDAKEAMDMINNAGIDLGGDKSNTLKGAIKGITAEQADLLSGQFGGMRIAQLETNYILRSGAAAQMQSSSRLIELQTQIEINTRSTASNTLATVEELKKLNNKGNQNNDLLNQRASGAWIR